MTDSNLITCNLLGPGDGTANYGLGNQMFQVASLMSHALDNNLSVSFPQIKLNSFGGYHQNIFRNVPSHSIDFKNFHYQNVGFHYHELPKHGGIVYKGYFQSEKYFKHNRSLIIKLFSPSTEDLEYISSKYSFILDKKTISIHIRRGDYLNLPNHHPLPSLEYYSKSIDLILSQKKIDKYVVFSDDIEWCKNVFGDNSDIFYIQNEPDYIDLYLMSLCTHNIIANSTFSWWGAWLNTNPKKIVISPKTWFGKARMNLNTSDLLPDTWIKL